MLGLHPAQESLLYEKGREMGIIPEDGTPTKEPTYTGEKVPQFVFGKLKPAQKAQILRAVYLTLNGVKQKPQAPADLGLLFRPEKRYIAGPVSNDVRKVLETPQAERILKPEEHSLRQEPEPENSDDQAALRRSRHHTR